MANPERPSRSKGMNQFLRDYDEYCAEIEWEQELIRLGRLWEESLVVQAIQDVKEPAQDPNQIILNLETDDDGEV
jgi:hypothetical protein